jgi:hypothetical protein
MTAAIANAPESKPLWRKRQSLYTIHAEVVEVRGTFCRVRFVGTGAQCVIPLDPATGGHRGYEVVPEHERGVEEP